jgi:hypothetical protein
VAIPKHYRLFWLLFLLFNLAVLLKSGSYYGGYLRGSDGQLYYAYARSLFFDGDFDFTNEYALTPYSNFLDPIAIAQTASGRPGNKYTIGFGLLALPFIALGHLATLLINATGLASFAPDGYSLPYQFATALGQLSLALLGAYLTFLFLNTKFKTSTAFSSVMLVWFGTSLFYYSAIFPFMSHAAGFFCLAALCYLLNNKVSTARAVVIGAVAGLGLVVRPTNIVLYLFLLPLVRSNLLGQRWRVPLFALISATLVIALQLISWYRLYGIWTPYTYGDEKFNWGEPQFLKVLFSTNHGLLFYSPVLLFSIIGLVAAIRNRADKLTTFGLVSFLLLFYINASWHAWWFGHAFGARSFVEAGPIFAYGMCLFVAMTQNVNKLRYATLLLCVLWTTFLLYSFMTGRIPPAGEFEITKLF